jgi:hypothetical protein
MTNSKFQDELRKAAERHCFLARKYTLCCTDPCTCNEELKESWQNITSLISRATDLDGEKVIYKHQCGHCQRFSPLPFMVHIESYEMNTRIFKTPRGVVLGEQFCDKCKWKNEAAIGFKTDHGLIYWCHYCTKIEELQEQIEALKRERDAE